MASQTIRSILKPADCAPALADFQPAMFAGVHPRDRPLIVQNVQIVGKTAKLFQAPTNEPTEARQ